MLLEVERCTLLCAGLLTRGAICAGYSTGEVPDPATGIGLRKPRLVQSSALDATARRARNDLAACLQSPQSHCLPDSGPLHAGHRPPSLRIDGGLNSPVYRVRLPF